MSHVEPRMSEPEMDADGYPTEATLAAVREWVISGFAACDALLRFVQRAWNWPDLFVRLAYRKRPWRGGQLNRRWLVSTGGWSGNESLIGALEDNTLFWLLCWEKSERGGHYEFRVPEP